jgi:hypothetical protein
MEESFLLWSNPVLLQFLILELKRLRSKFCVVPHEHAMKP